MFNLASLIQIVLLVSIFNSARAINGNVVYAPLKNSVPFYDGPQGVYMTYGVFNPVTQNTDKNTACPDLPMILSYNRDTALYTGIVCCNGVASLQTVSTPSAILNFKCCNNVAYTADKSFCCGGIVYPIIPQNFNLLIADTCWIYSYGCCKGIVYDRSSQICCDNRLHSAKFGINTGCCGSSPYKPPSNGFSMLSATDTYTFKKSEPDQYYEPKLYDITSQICCSGKVSDIISSSPSSSPACCGNQAYDLSKQICCGTNVVNRDWNVIYPACCAGNKFDATQEICCNGFVHKFNEDPLEPKKCCGINSYNPKKEKCCGGKIIDTCNDEDENMKCCGIQSYDKRKQICCSGVVLDADSKTTKCCGLNPYNKESHICCNHDLIMERAKGKKCPITNTNYN